MAVSRESNHTRFHSIYFVGHLLRSEPLSHRPEDHHFWCHQRIERYLCSYCLSFPPRSLGIWYILMYSPIDAGCNRQQAAPNYGQHRSLGHSRSITTGFDSPYKSMRHCRRGLGSTRDRKCLCSKEQRKEKKKHSRSWLRLRSICARNSRG
ncbi:hypothetical protein BDN72DRAFT_597049 [Pluteus cervinus]|uniref:Uncharacterized protein n=1 Tax=Pluteus cervinus TaxID=181527 RepID=A0ACD3A1K2_9AGAR|nr:hypothetical protein BDN72DRAFT_597049 [Pluteus cervinus]